MELRCAVKESLPVLCHSPHSLARCERAGEDCRSECGDSGAASSWPPRPTTDGAEISLFPAQACVVRKCPHYHQVAVSSFVEHRLYYLYSF